MSEISEIDLYKMDRRSSLIRAFLGRAGEQGLIWTIKKALSLGPAGTFQWAFGRLRYIAGVAVDRRFDRQFNVNTCGFIREVPTDSSSVMYGHEYGPSPAKSLRFMLGSIPFDLEDFTFIDYGCGFGRALLIAAEKPFGRVIGIDYSSAFIERSKRNISNYRNPDQRCETIEALYIDAISYEPPSGPVLFYFYSPFQAPVLMPVLDRIAKSYYRNPRALVILFAEIRDALPIPKDLFAKLDFLQEVDMPVLPFDIGAPAPLKYAVWASPEAFSN